jgi:hypothetical protein
MVRPPARPPACPRRRASAKDRLVITRNQIARLFIAAAATGATISSTAQPAQDAGKLAIDFSYAGYGAGSAIPLVPRLRTSASRT